MNVQTVGVNSANENLLTAKVEISRTTKALSIFLKVITLGIWCCVANYNCSKALESNNLAAARTWVQLGASSNYSLGYFGYFSELATMPHESFIFMRNNEFMVHAGKGEMSTPYAIFYVAVEQRSEKLLGLTNVKMDSDMAIYYWNRYADGARNHSASKAYRLMNVERCEFMMANGFTHPNRDLNLQDRIKTMKDAIQNDIGVR
jgi:hypothetical protein